MSVFDHLVNTKLIKNISNTYGLTPVGKWLKSIVGGTVNNINRHNSRQKGYLPVSKYSDYTQCTREGVIMGYILSHIKYIIHRL